MGVVIPRPPGLAVSHHYFLAVAGDNKTAELANKLILHPTASTLPAPGPAFKLGTVVSWQPSAQCGALLCNQCKVIDGWYPPTRDALGPNEEDWWPDLWTDPFWARFKTHLDDTSREWEAVCSAAWGTSRKIGGLTVPAIVTLPSGTLYWLSIDTTSHEPERLALRLRYDHSPGFVTDDFCTEDTTDPERRMPDDCTKWKANGATSINIHLVGGFELNGDPVDPADVRGIASPINIHTSNTQGMVILSDNPSLNARVKTKDLDAQNPQCVAHWYKTGDPTAQTYWWGPEPAAGGRSVEHTPNLLAHELHHTVTGYVHDPGGGPDPCGTPAVGGPTEACPRGFNMALSSSLTVDSECARAVNSPFTQ